MQNTTAATLPTTPAGLAELIRDFGDTGLIAALTAQIGWVAARPLLAEAHGIVSADLWNA